MLHPLGDPLEDTDADDIMRELGPGVYVWRVITENVENGELVRTVC